MLISLETVSVSPETASVVAILISGFIYLVLGYVPWKQWGKPGVVSFSIMSLITGIFGIYLSYSLYSFDSSRVLLSYLPLYILPVPWSVFVLKYTGYSDIEMFSPKGFLLLLPAVLGVILNIFLWGTETRPNLLLSVGRLVAFVSLFYVLGLVIVTTSYLLRMSYSYEYLDLTLASLITIGGMGPWVSLVFGVLLNYSKDVALGIWGGGFILSATVMVYSVARYPVFDMMPAAGEIGSEKVVEQLEEPIIVLDSNRRIARVNPEAERLFNASAEEVVGGDLENFIGVGLDTVRREDSVELEVVDGEREFECTVTAITDEVGRILGHTMILHDVTERESRKKRIRELNRMKEELEEKNEKLDEFASTISHDLRNPLSVARGNIQIEMEKRDDESEFLENAEQAHDRMADLIEDLLTLARQGETIDEPAPADLEKAVETAWGNVDTKDAELETEELERIEADWDKLIQALENLIRNSIEHGGEDVTVTVGMLNPAKDLGTGFYFEDDGPGIPEDERDEVFEHGFTTDRQGTGLGLSIVEGIIDAHNWNIKVGESEGGGARFEISDVSVLDE